MTPVGDFILDREVPVVGRGGPGHPVKPGLLPGEEPVVPLGRFVLTRPALAVAPQA